MPHLNFHRRILVIDDSAQMHADYRKVLQSVGTSQQTSAQLDDMEAALFGAPAEKPALANMGLNFEVDSAMQGEEGLDKLNAAIAENRPYAMAFVDMRMPPGWDGVQTIRELWKVDRDLQVVICTAYSDYSPQQISESLGITDQLLILRKPFDPMEVRQLALTMTEKWRSVHQQKNLERLVHERTAELRHAATHDALTSLPNRLVFNDRLEQAVRRSKRDTNYRFAVMFVDCDNFKMVNDSLGHPAGDELLLQMSARMRSAVRDVDTVARPQTNPADEPITARLGGDEFAILLEAVNDPSGAARVAQRVLDSLSKPYKIGGHDLLSTVSIGITLSTVGYETAQDVIRDADLAMYRAKSAGRSRYFLFDQQMHEQATTRLTIEADMRKGFKTEQFSLQYQPIMQLRTRALIGFEALARWNHPKQGWVSPSEFIPLAEDTGLIVPLGYWVLETALTKLSEWHAKFSHVHRLTMSVNVSRKQLLVTDLFQRIKQMLTDRGLNPSDLKLEITEGNVTDDTKIALEAIRKVRELGVHVCIDDFGSGNAALSGLHNWPMDGLKIDRDFVHAVDGERSNLDVMRAVVGLAHGLKVPLVAEGIETQEQMRILDSIGCDHAQGFFLGRPMDASDAENFIAGEFAKVSAA